jgi:recombination protein RecA
MNLVEKSGAWFSFGGDRIGQGRENAKAYLDQHPDVMDKLEALILAKHGIKRAPAVQSVPVNGVVETDDKPKRVPTIHGKPAN